MQNKENKIMEFQKFNKIPRLSRDMIITEKIDGTNAQVYIVDNNTLLQVDSCSDEWYNQYCLYQESGLSVFAGSRNRWLDTSSKGDNHGFAKWVQQNTEELMKLGEGRHFGEWYGQGIQRGYGLEEKRFALFNVGKWANRDTPIEVSDKREYCPECCEVVPVLSTGTFDTKAINDTLRAMRCFGSKAVLGFMNPEGIVIYHKASGQLFKKTIVGDEKPKGVSDA